MGKIYYMMGKSASGKDTLYKEVRKMCPQLGEVILYTTRPIRDGETEGVEYYFTTKEKLDAFAEEGKLIEVRTYHTVHGDWHYATVDDGQIDLGKKDYLTIGTLESYQKMRAYYGDEQMVPFYIEVEDGERLKRAIAREEAQTQPSYAEMCRRFLADAEDFSEENLRKAGITRRYQNTDRESCIRELIEEVPHEQL